MSTENKWFDMSRKTDAEGKQSSGAEISINDNIGGWGITANDFIAELKDLGDVDEINVRISSGGGSIVEGNAIFNELKRHPAKVITHIDSIAASMASVIAMAGDEVRMAANALFMIHNPWTASIGGAEQLRKDADLLDKMENNIRNSYDRSNLSVDELSAAMDADTYYTAEEALEAGFIDSIGDANLAAASIGDMETIKGFANIPQAKIDEIKITCQAKQIEALDARATELAGDLDIMRENVLIADGELLHVTAEVATLKEGATKATAEHVKALETATEQTQEAISAKAAELLAESGTPPIESAPEGNEGNAHKMDRETAKDGYDKLVALRDFQGAQEFFAEHRDLLA